MDLRKRANFALSQSDLIVLGLNQGWGRRQVLYFVNGAYYDLFGPWGEDSLSQKSKPTSSA